MRGKESFAPYDQRGGQPIHDVVVSGAMRPPDQVRERLFLQKLGVRHVCNSSTRHKGVCAQRDGPLYLTFDCRRAKVWHTFAIPPGEGVRSEHGASCQVWP